MLVFTNTFGRALFDIMGVQRGRKSAGQPKPEFRSVVEHGLAVVRVYNSLESHWWAIAFPNFAAGAVPILCILHRAAGSDFAVSQVATRSDPAEGMEGVVWLEALPLRDERAWWCECMDALGDVARTEEWQMQLHRVTHAIPPSSPGSPSTLLAAQPMGESKQWWQGLLSVERAAQEPTPDLPLEPEDENGEDMPDELPEEELPPPPCR